MTLLPLWLPPLYLVIHALLVLFSPHPLPQRNRILLRDLGLIVAFVSLIAFTPWLLQRKAPGIEFICLWSPIIFFWIGYLWAGETLESLYPPGVTFDREVMALEKRLFGQPSLWLAKNRPPWLTETMHFFYASYYAYTPVLGIYLYHQRRFIEFEAFSFAVLFGYIVSYTFFALTPVLGPRWSLVEEGLISPGEQHLKGYWITRFMNRLMYQGLAHKGGAMPSSHSSTALVFLVWGLRIWGFEGGVLAGIVVFGMWTGSVYGRYHFLLDVLIGAALGTAGVLIGDSLILSQLP